MKRTIAVVTTSRADYSHLYWPLRELAAHPEIDLGVFVLGPHLSPEFGNTINEIERDGFPIEARIECLLSSDTDTGMAKTIGLAILGLADALTRLAARPAAADRRSLRDACARQRRARSAHSRRAHRRRRDQPGRHRRRRPQCAHQAGAHSLHLDRNRAARA